MNDQPTSPPVPTSVLDYRATHESGESQNAGISPHSTTLARRTSVAQLEEQQRPPQSASAPQFSADARFVASTQRPVAYSHGYPTPPSHLAALSPVNDPQSQSRAVAPPMVPIPPSHPPPMASQGPSQQQPQRRSSASFQNPAPYPTPPTHSTALSPDQQRSPMAQPPPPLFGMFPPPPSTPTEIRQPHLSHAPLPQSHIAFPPAANSSVPRGGPRTIAPYPQRPSDMPQAQGSVRRNSSTSQQHQQQQQHHQHHHHSQQQQRPMPSAHASTSHQPPPPPVPVPFPQPHTIQTTSFASPYSISTSTHPYTPPDARPPLPPPPPPPAVVQQTPSSSSSSSAGAAVPGTQLAYHHELERRVHWHEAERSTLQAQLEKTRAEFDAYAQHAVGMNGALRAERDAARQDVVRLRGLRDAARTDAAEQARVVKAMEVNEQGYQKKAVEMEAHSQHLAGLARRWEQTTRQLVTHVARLRAERGALQARVQALEAAAASARGGEVAPAAVAAVADVAPGINIIPKTEPVADEDMNAVDISVKPEPLDDDLELQYPPDLPEPVPAPTFTSTLIPTAPPIPTPMPSIPPAGPSTFITWDPLPSFPAAAEEDRKRSRAEYELASASDADEPPAVRARLLTPLQAQEQEQYPQSQQYTQHEQQGQEQEGQQRQQREQEPSLGAPFPLASLPVGARNSPVRYFNQCIMEVRRKGGGVGVGVPVPGGCGVGGGGG